MSQPSGYQPQYPDLLKSGPPLPMSNGQSSAPPVQNGTQSASFTHPTGMNHEKFIFLIERFDRILKISSNFLYLMELVFSTPSLCISAC